MHPKNRICTDPIILETVKDIRAQWNEDRYGVKMWPSQVELLFSFVYWLHYDLVNQPIRYLYLYPTTGSTALWLCIEKALEEVIVIPATSDMLKQHHFSNKLSIARILQKPSLMIRDKIVIADGAGITYSRGDPEKILGLGARAIVIT